ncbi:MAG: radical SAM protein [Armatimonadota bacterium]|nr:radical SAM protein [Armatimonadota bacterium]MDR5703439.1 radical SAM protein [Armatimonadota bacterium]MDR7434350.1 radical SAM protein [Armatimonadota bacterium]
MKILLIQPRRSSGLGFHPHALVEPLGLEMVAGALDAHQVSILDLLPSENLQAALESFRPDACGISCTFTVDVYRTLEIAAKIKEILPHCFVFVGGHHATLNPMDFFQGSVDAVILGEGETIAPALLRALQTGEDLRTVPGLMLFTPEGPYFTGLRSLLEDLDHLPFPARHLTAPYRRHYHLGLNPIATVETARGCPYRCNFCSVWRFYRKRFRSKSPERVIAELLATPGSQVLFTDDNFLTDIRRAFRIAELVRQHRIRKEFLFQARSDSIVRHPEVITEWRKAGLSSVFIGFEKIDDEALESVEKRNSVANNERALEILRRLKIRVVASFIVDPNDGPNEFSRLRAYVRRLRIRTPTFSVLTPLPGTQLFETLRQRLTTTNYELFDLLHAVLPTRLPLPEFYREMARLYRSAYLGQFANWLSTARALTAGLVRGRISLGRVKDSVLAGWNLFNPRSYLADHARTAMG